MTLMKEVTSDAPHKYRNAVIMGRRTWESIPEKHRPLGHRTNVVLSSRKLKLPTKVLLASSLSDALDQLSKQHHLNRIYLIGGGSVFQEAIDRGFCNKVIYTEMYNVESKFDTFFPQLLEEDWTVQPFNFSEHTPDPESHVSCRFLEYKKRNTEELQYLTLCREIMSSGIRREDQTGTIYLGLFGKQIRFSLRNGHIPLLTTKRTFWRGVAEELLWLVSGNTNSHDLRDKGIRMCDGNASSEPLDSAQSAFSSFQEGHSGFQMRHLGASYVDRYTDYTGQGVDQLAECIDKIKNKPSDRNIVLTAPPNFWHFSVDTVNNEVSCLMYQRSADMGLAAPFSIASYALLLHMIVHVTGRKAGDFIHTIGDAHIYLDHVNALEEQLTREPRDFPTLYINPEKRNIDDFVLEDFEVKGYNPHNSIKMKMAF
jgi:dihydrofolate reductase/thymidylate synthase